jgi:hypothetical protein
MKIEEFNKLSTEQIRDLMITEGYATREQEEKLRGYGFSGGIATLTQKRAEELITQAENKKRQPSVAATKSDMVTCWECGCSVHINEATYDGNGWYCGC